LKNKTSFEKDDLSLTNQFSNDSNSLDSSVHNYRNPKINRMALKEQFSNKKDSRLTANSNSKYSQESSFNQIPNNSNSTPNLFKSKSKSKFDLKLDLDKVKKGVSTEE